MNTDSHYLTMNYVDGTQVTIGVDKDLKLRLEPDVETVARCLHDFVWVGSKGLSVSFESNLFIKFEPYLELRWNQDSKIFDFTWNGAGEPTGLLELQKLLQKYTNLRAFW